MTNLSDLNPRATISEPNSIGRRTVVTPQGETVLSYPIKNLFRFNTSLNDDVTGDAPVAGTDDGAAIIYMPVFQGNSLYASEALTNYHANPSIEANSTGWTAAGTSTVSRQAGISFLGDYCLKWTYGGSGSQSLHHARPSILTLKVFCINQKQLVCWRELQLREKKILSHSMKQ